MTFVLSCSICPEDTLEVVGDAFGADIVIVEVDDESYVHLTRDQIKALRKELKRVLKESV